MSHITGKYKTRQTANPGTADEFLSTRLGKLSAVESLVEFFKGEAVFLSAVVF
jgi:hypothetical protein